MDKQLSFPISAYVVTEEDIWNAVSRHAEGATRSQIAKQVGRKVTPHLIAKIEALVEQNWLERYEVIRPNGARKFIYKVVCA